MWLRSAEVGWGPFLSNTTIKLTSIISVWASLLQDVDGGDIVLISTNALGNCPSSGLSRLWQAEKWNKQLRAYCPPLRMKNAKDLTQNLLSSKSIEHNFNTPLLIWQFMPFSKGCLIHRQDEIYIMYMSQSVSLQKNYKQDPNQIALNVVFRL